MFPNLQKKLVFLYTASTGLIMTLILSFAFLFYISSQKNKERSDFQDHLFILMSNLQTESIFADSYLSKMEEKNHLIIYIEENGSPLFFPGSYHPSTDRNILLARTEDYAKSEGIYPASHPISSNLLQSSIFQIKGNERDSYLGTGGLVRAYSAAVKEGIASSVIITRIRGVKLEISTDYTGLGKIQYILGQRGIRILNSEYTDAVRLEVLLAEEVKEQVKAEITEGTNGQAGLNETEALWFAEIDGVPTVLGSMSGSES